MTTYRIPQENLGTLTHELEKLQRRAARIGCEPATYAITGTEESPVHDELGELVGYRVYVLLDVSGAAPRYAGWTFIATLEQAGEAGNLLRAMPGATVPEHYRTADASQCDHCRTRRRRNQVYIVRHDDGTYRQVGSNCLADFLGHPSPDELARQAEHLARVADLMAAAEDCGFGAGGRASAIATLTEFVNAAAAANRVHGWVSRTQAREDWTKTATADRAWERLFPESAVARRTAYPITDEDRELAAAAIEWARELTDTDGLSDFLWNVHIVVSGATVNEKQAGLAAWLPEGYRRELGRRREHDARAAAGANSQHFGTPGKRETFTLTVTDIRFCDGMYGRTALHTFIDDHGNIAKWFSSNDELTAGTRYQVKATVKKHDTYEGTAQTVLTRCTVVRELGAAA